MDIEDKLFWLREVRREIQEQWELHSDLAPDEDYRAMLDAIDEAMEDVWKLEELMY